jgi:hypothetical protein
MQTVRNWYLNRILNNLPFLLEHFDEARGSFCCGDAVDQHCLRPFAYLYKNRIDGNPYFGNKSILQKVLRGGDAMITHAKPSRHGGTLGGEWKAYNLVECADWLGDELGTERLKRWRDALSAHIELMKLTSNYIATAPNHFIWRAALFARAGRLFKNDAWLRTAQMLARQVSKLQTADGYWDEAHRAHGPSPAYHRVHLHGLDLYYRNSDDELIKPVLDKAIEFSIRSAYPDGTPIETFDGRQPYSGIFGVGSHALSRHPQGRRMLRNSIAFLDRIGSLDVKHPTGFAMSWYAFAGTDFLIDSYRFIEDGPEEPLPQERDDHRDTFIFTGGSLGAQASRACPPVVEKGHEEEGGGRGTPALPTSLAGVGGGTVMRAGPWFSAVSAIESDVPRFVSNVYITERQSGFSVSHSEAGLLVGGGNRMRNHVPLANAIVLTGWENVDCNAGVFSAPYLDEVNAKQASADHGQQRPGHEGIDPVKCCYHPIQRRVELKEDRALLTLDFMHGQIQFELRALDAGRFQITYAFETLNTKKILLQIPIPLFYPGEFSVDGKVLHADPTQQIQTVPLRQNLMRNAHGHAVRFTVSEPAAFTFAVEPIKNGVFNGTSYAPDKIFKPLYSVGLISEEFRAERKDGVLATIEVD